MKIVIHDTQKDLSISKISIENLVFALCKELNVKSDEIIINFVTHERIEYLHEEFFDDPSPTDCITFPIDGCTKKSDNYHIIGEVFVCPKTALNVNPKNAYQETSLYLIHTILHLIGYEDTEDNLKSIMELKQNHLMNLIKSKNLLLTK